MIEQIVYDKGFARSRQRKTPPPREREPRSRPARCERARGTTIREICDIVHSHGGQVYMDGANMNAQVGLAFAFRA